MHSEEIDSSTPFVNPTVKIALTSTHLDSLQRGLPEVHSENTRQLNSTKLDSKYRMSV